MSKTIEELRADLADAEERQRQDAAAETAKAKEAADAQRAKDAITAEIKNEEEGIAHLEEKIARRRARIAELKSTL